MASIQELINQVPPEVRYERKPLDERQNALPIWRQAAERVVGVDELGAIEDELTGEEREGGPCCWLQIGFPQGERSQRWRELLDANREAIGLFEQGARLPGFQLPAKPHDLFMDDYVIWVNQVRNLFRVVMHDIWREVADEKLDRAAERYALAMRAAALVTHGDGMIIQFLVGTAFQGMATHPIDHLIDRTDASASALAALQKEVGALPSTQAAWEQSLRVELCSYELSRVAKLSQLNLDEIVDQLVGPDPTESYEFQLPLDELLPRRERLKRDMMKLLASSPPI